jgi:hypothetical protein
MTDTLNRKVADKLGIHWHEGSMYKEPSGNRHYGCSKCGSAESNPDFTKNAAVLLGELKKKDYYDNFMDSIDTMYRVADKKDKDGLFLYYVDECFVNIDYILNPRLLCERFLEWEG